MVGLLVPAGPLASNPGPHDRHRICDRREEGLVKPSVCFVSLPTMVGKISTQNSEARVPFSSRFLTAKNGEVSPRRRLRSSMYKHKEKPSSSTPQHAHKRRRGKEKDEDFLVKKSLTLWPKIYSPLWTKHFSFLLFFFFFWSRFSVGKTPASCLREQHHFRTRSIGQASPWSTFTVRKKGCISSPNNASALNGARHALFVMMETNPEMQTKLSLKDLGWSSSSTWQRHEVSSS